MRSDVSSRLKRLTQQPPNDLEQTLLDFLLNVAIGSLFPAQV